MSRASDGIPRPTTERRGTAGLSPTVVWRVVALGIPFVLLSSCYVLGQGVRLVGHQLRAEPIEQVSGHDEFFASVREIREFARTELGLAATENYTRFVEVESDHLVTVVSAVERGSFSRKTWWFPVFGRFPYKGFYREASARRLGRRLERRGYDVFLRPVDAFSTLGYFRDPLFSFMTDYDEFRLASLLIHEQTHATLFVRNDVQFNEELATFVGYHGALQYLRSLHGRNSEQYLEASAYWDELDIFLAQVRSLHSRLTAVYESDLHGHALLRRKEAEIHRFQAEYAHRYDELFSSDRFRWFADYPINNAVIDVYMKYTQDLSIFDSLYDHLDRSIPAMIDALQPVVRYDGPPKEYIREVILYEATQS